MAMDDGACLPVFEGDPDLSPIWPPRGFAWRDFQLGVGQFEVEESNSEGGPTWKFIGSSEKDGVVVTVHSRALPEKGGLSEFMIRGSLPIRPDVYFALNADMEYRPEWDSTTTSVSELASSGPGPEAGFAAQRSRMLHWEVKYPWPLGRRDYVLEQNVHSEDGDDDKCPPIRCIQGRTLSPEECNALRPCESGITRIEDYRANMTIWTGSCPEEACFALLYFEDSKVSLPNWLISKGVASTIPSSLAGAVPVAKSYPPIRLYQTLVRFGPLLCDIVPPSPSGSKLSRDPEPDSESFYSASDSEESDEEDAEESTAVRRLPVRPQILDDIGSESSTCTVSTVCSASAVPKRSFLPSFFGSTKDVPSPSLPVSKQAGCVASNTSPSTKRSSFFPFFRRKSKDENNQSDQDPFSKAVSAPNASSSKERRHDAGNSTTPAQKSLKPSAAAATSTTAVSVAAVGQHAKMAANSNGASAEVGSDLEEGLLYLSKEERTLLLEVLSESRARRGSAVSGWWPAMCCSCGRRLCGKRRKER